VLLFFAIGNYLACQVLPPPDCSTEKFTFRQQESVKLE